MINVLQAMILTDKEKIVLTPTYHAFEMYHVHQDATLLASELQSPDYAFDSQNIPALSASASRDRENRIHITICNLDPKNSAPLGCELPGVKSKKASGRILTAAEITSHNTFNNPGAVKPAAFDEVHLNESGFTAILPPKSIVAIELE
jgi:alpha-N-arabinofuranosidase